MIIRLEISLFQQRKKKIKAHFLLKIEWKIEITHEFFYDKDTFPIGQDLLLHLRRKSGIISIFL